MPLYNFSHTVATANALTRIGASTGIDHMTRNSILRNMAESNSQDALELLESTNNILGQLYIESASGRFLDAKAYEMGLNRNIIDKVMVFAADEAIRIEPITEGKTFGDFLGPGNYVIPENTELGTISNKFSIISMEPVPLGPSDSFRFISVRIEPKQVDTATEGRVFKLSENQIVDIDVRNPVMSPFGRLQMRAVKPIVIETASETDEQLRIRLIEAKSNLIEGTPEAIGSVLRNIPGVLGYKIRTNVRNKNSVDIGLVTQSMIDGGASNFLPLYVKNISEDMLPIGTDLTVKFPTRCEIFIDYRSSYLEIIPEESLQETIKHVINTSFIYSQDNSLIKRDIEMIVKNTLKEIKLFEIQRIRAYDTDMEEFVFESNDDIILPFNYYAYVTDPAQLINVTATL